MFLIFHFINIKIPGSFFRAHISEIFVAATSVSNKYKSFSRLCHYVSIQSHPTHSSVSDQPPPLPIMQADSEIQPQSCSVNSPDWAAVHLTQLCILRMGSWWREGTVVLMAHQFCKECWLICATCLFLFCSPSSGFYLKFVYSEKNCMFLHQILLRGVWCFVFPSGFCKMTVKWLFCPVQMRDNLPVCIVYIVYFVCV